MDRDKYVRINWENILTGKNLSFSATVRKLPFSFLIFLFKNFVKEESAD